jgi:hypothetical protein
MMAKKPAERPSYVELGGRLAQILTRLDPSAVPDLIMASRDRSRPITLPTPSRPDVLPPPADDSATLSEGDLAMPRALPGWLWMVTVACLALFVVGLVMYLKRGGDAAGAGFQSGIDGKGSTTVDAAATVAVVDAPGPSGEAGVPSNMLTVRKPDGTTWFYVDPQPVTVREFRSVFATHVQPGREEDPVTSVSYNEARSYAQTAGRRLMTSEEWDAAAVTPGFIVSDGIFEWIDSEDDHKKLVRQHGKTLQRPDKEQKDVTFRTAKDP